jgi:hypothetical protein
MGRIATARRKNPVNGDDRYCALKNQGERKQIRANPVHGQDRHYTPKYPY